jgi:TubC N-terminal docking domain
MIRRTSADVVEPEWRFLATLRKLDLRVSDEQGRLRVSAPPGVLTAELREELAARKVEILDFLRQSNVSNGDAGPLLRAIPRDQPLPLSFAQQRLWMVEQMNPGTQGACRQIGRLSANARSCSGSRVGICIER